MAERTGFEPAVRYTRTHAFQACSLSRSDTSPFNNDFLYFCCYYYILIVKMKILLKLKIFFQSKLFINEKKNLNFSSISPTTIF